MNQQNELQNDKSLKDIGYTKRA